MENFLYDIWQNNFATIWPWLLLGYIVYIVIPWLGWRPNMPKISVMLGSIYRVCIGIFLLIIIFIVINFIQFILTMKLDLSDSYIDRTTLILNIIRWLTAISFLYYFMIKHRPYVPTAILPFGLAYIILPCSLFVSTLLSHIINYLVITFNFQPLGLHMPDLPWFFGVAPNWISFFQVAIVALGLELMYQIKRPIFSILAGYAYFYAIEIFADMIGYMAWIYACILPIAWVAIHLKDYQPMPQNNKRKTAKRS